MPCASARPNAASKSVDRTTNHIGFRRGVLPQSMHSRDSQTAQHAQSARRSRQSGSIMAGQPHRQYTLRDNCRLCGTRMRFQAEPRLLKAPELLVGSVQRRDPEVPMHYKQSTEYNLCIVARHSRTHVGHTTLPALDITPMENASTDRSSSRSAAVAAAGAQRSARHPCLLVT